MKTTAFVWSLGAALALLASPIQASAQDSLETAKARYAEAAYEEALQVLARAADTPDIDRVELEQYRALCLIALGRTEEATDAVATIVAANPRYVPPSSIASPKVVSLVSEVREEQLPGIIRGLITSGRSAYEAGSHDAARRDFALALTLLDDDVLKEWSGREDVRVLADGFAALADAADRRAAANGPAPRPGASGTPAGDRSAPGPAAEPPSAAPAAAEPSEPVATTGSTEAPVPTALAVLPPVAVMQTMPAWIPPDGFAQARGYEGTLKIVIGSDGRVKSAAIEEPSHPAYDVRLLHAARQWVFKPATRDGQPVESEKIIAVQLHPRN